ncbi:hypothetical protein [Nostoc favosum]|uniref:hypothetical protein n=1 Tax=Nostoc favosum TaxID=2907819 RepID=UPI00279527F7|nr:hypothetical protein [Nostoc favosum]
MLKQVSITTNRELKQLQDPKDDIGQYTHHLFTPNGLTLIAMLGVYLLMKLFLGDGSNKKKLASSYWGGRKEIETAKKKALKQIKSSKCDSAALCIGKNFYIPDIQRGTAAIGAPGSGKTYSAINPMIFNAISFGYPILLYDFKYPSQAKIAAYAKKMGDDLQYIAFIAYRARYIEVNIIFNRVLSSTQIIDLKCLGAKWMQYDILYKSYTDIINMADTKFYLKPGV